MPGCEILICLPSYPFTLESLTPNFEVSVLAARLRAVGADVTTHDFSNLNTFDRFFDRSSSGRLPYGLERGSEGARRSRGRGRIRQRLFEIVRHLMVETFSRGHLSGTRAWFHAETADEYAVCYEAASILSSLHPEVAVRFCGSYAEKLGHSASVDTAILRFSSDEESDDTSMPCPSYESDIDSILREKTKALVFTLPDITPEKSPLWHARLLTDRIAALQSRYGGAGFHINEAHPGTALPEALGREILARRLRILYSRDALPGGTPSRAFATLRLSGCSAIEYCVHTGSQRLLDEHFNHPISVSRTEGQLRGSVYSGIYTVAHFTYPCPEDDYHTFAETVRLIERSRPNAVKVALPHTLPLSPRQLRERSRLLGAIQNMGISTTVTTKTALMAALAGHSGEEREFADDVERRFRLGDISGLAGIVDRINAPQRAVAMGACPRPFELDMSAVVN